MFKIEFAHLRIFTKLRMKRLATRCTPSLYFKFLVISSTNLNALQISEVETILEHLNVGPRNVVIHISETLNFYRRHIFVQRNMWQ
jgi:hypothetical protein